MKRISHDSYASVIGAVYLGLMANVLLVVACAPVVLLLITTDPSRSWPLIAIAAPLCAPGVVGAFAAFRDHRDGGTAVVRTFLRGWRGAWRRAVPFAALAVALLVVLLVDVRAVAAASFGVVVVPLLAVLASLAVATTLVALVAFAEAPRARLRDVARASLYFATRRWYLTALSLLVLGLQFALFAAMPAIGLGVSAAPALYLAWANSRHCLRPVLDPAEAPAA